MYRGEALPALCGQYVFGDWSAHGHLEPAALLFVARSPSYPSQVHPYFRERDLWGIRKHGIEGRDGLGRYVTSFGRDRDGELYVMTAERSAVEGTTGLVHQIT